MRKSLPETVREAARRATKMVISITPPAHEGISGADAYRFGRMRIYRDMSSVLAPVRLKGKRRERWPDVAAVYRANRRFRKSGVGVTAKARSPKFYVDTRKFNTLLKEKESHVGRLASGFAAAAIALDLPLQTWISRHGTGRGMVKTELASPRMRITVVNFAPNLPSNVQAELARRIPYALTYVANGMARNIDVMVRKTAREFGIKTREVFDALGF
jgi:hypothetical protein